MDILHTSKSKLCIGEQRMHTRKGRKTQLSLVCCMSDFRHIPKKNFFLEKFWGDPLWISDIVHNECTDLLNLMQYIRRTSGLISLFWNNQTLKIGKEVRIGGQMGLTPCLTCFCSICFVCQQPCGCQFLPSKLFSASHHQ